MQHGGSRGAIPDSPYRDTQYYAWNTHSQAVDAINDAVDCVAQINFLDTMRGDDERYDLGDISENLSEEE